MHTFFNPDREGWLWKQGGRYKSWKRRWFILNDNCLYYFEFTTDKVYIYVNHNFYHSIYCKKCGTLINSFIHIEGTAWHHTIREYSSSWGIYREKQATLLWIIFRRKWSNKSMQNRFWREGCWRYKAAISSYKIIKLVPEVITIDMYD